MIEGEGTPRGRRHTGDLRWLFVLGATVAFPLVTVLGLSIATIGLADSTGARSASSVGAPNGAAIYAANCSRCHGASGEGGIGPQLAGVVVENYPNPSFQELVVKTGRGAMPAFGATLSPEEITAVVDYEREELGVPASSE